MVNLLNSIIMSAYHLRKSEVEYELRVRALPYDGTAAELRKQLSLAIGSDVEVTAAAVNALDATTELQECEQKFQDLSALITDYEGDYKDNEFHRIVARLWHLYLRADRIPIAATIDEEYGQTKDLLVRKSKELLDSFKDKDVEEQSKKKKAVKENDLKTPGKLFQNLSMEDWTLPHLTLQKGTENQAQEDLPRLHGHLQENRNLEEEERMRRVKQLQEERRKLQQKWLEEERRLQKEKLEQEEYFKRAESQLLVEVTNTEEVTPNVPGSLLKAGKGMLSDERREYETYSRPRYVPVFKWGIKFDSTGPSIASFLERVEELRRARGVTHQELFDSAVDLFAGPALVWYRSSAGRIYSWTQLCRELREVFQPPDYDFRLQQEIFNRFQGEKESIDLYVAAMEGLYGRLSVNVPEVTRLTQIFHNLHPQLQDRLALVEIKTLEDLRTMGRRVEAGRLRQIRPRPSASQGSSLEPDLAYQDPVHRRAPLTGRVAVITEESTQRRFSGACWNCGRDGHRFSFCRNPRKKFCYGCGKEDTVKKDCERCSPKNGDAREPAK